MSVADAYIGRGDVFCRQQALKDVLTERLRQEQRWQQTCADPKLDEGVKLQVLVEEVGELAAALQGDAGAGHDVRDELVQVAAVALAWIEART